MLRIALVIATVFFALPPAKATEAGWAQLREGGRVVLIRHANAPGSGDPEAFDIEDCSTQRNLSSRGEQQARRMGALFAARAARTEQVLSSRWCRSIETARLAFGAALVEPFDALDPIEPGSEEAERATAAILEKIRAYSGSGNLVMVTHQSTIEALTDFSPREAEAVIVATDGDGLRVTGRIIFN
jgi:broad specificity phosphatase PhoE